MLLSWGPIAKVLRVVAEVLGFAKKKEWIDKKNKPNIPKNERNIPR